ncbi:MAG TPA: CHAT domain-containing protein [Bacteroidales bacterium]|nr:CHAT domain-containing protein [Bacteroidales bacterium]
MAIRIKKTKPDKIKFILFLSLLIFPLFQGIYAQESQLSRDEFNVELRKALTDSNEQQTLSLIKNHRLFVKRFVDGLIQKSLDSELKGKTEESRQAQVNAGKAAADFEKLFGEKSLSIAVNYLTIWSKEQKEKKLVADSLYALGTKFRGSEPEKTIPLYQQSLKLYGEIGDERGEAEILGGLGLTYWNLDYKTSLSYYQDALTKREKVDDRQLTGNSLNSIGAIYSTFLKDYEKAIDYFERAGALRSEIGDLLNLNRTLSNKAQAYLRAGDYLNNNGWYPEALENLLKALEIHRSLNDKVRMGIVLNQIGYVYSNLGDNNTAIDKINEAAEIMKEENDMWELGGVYNHMGIVLQSAGRTEKAFEYYNNALKIYEEEEDQYNVLVLLSNLGTLFFDTKDYTRAEEYHSRVLIISRETNDKDLETRCLLNLANDQSLLGKLDKARSNYELAYEIAKSSNSPDLNWRIFAGMAENYEQRGEYSKAVELNDSALTILGGMRNTLKSKDWKASFMAMERYAFEDIIDMLGKLHEKDNTNGYDIRAFHYAELSKSRVLLDLLNESLPGNFNSDMVLGSGNQRNVETVSLEEVPALCLDKNTVILEYYVGDSSSCLWVITPSDHKLFMLPGSEKLREQVETLRFALLDPEQVSVEFLSRAGYELYEMLIKPAEKLLTKNSRIIVIPDGILYYLPFEVILTENKEISSDSSLKDLPFLIRKYPVSYVQSASVLRNLVSGGTESLRSMPSNKKLIAFGDPVYERENSLTGTPDNKYKRLEFSGKEVEMISSFFKKGDAEIFLRGEATEEEVKQELKLKKPGYLHFATHGLIDEDKPDLSSLVLTQDDDPEEDGLFQAAEIFNLDLDADLVVLSACQTGLGKLMRGEGMVGLTRAFMYAGAQSVLVSLWSVSDISTATLMSEFYKNLITRKLYKTDALRKAQLTLMSNEKFAHPFYWAPFVLIGDWR